MNLGIGRSGLLPLSFPACADHPNLSQQFLHHSTVHIAFRKPSILSPELASPVRSSGPLSPPCQCRITAMAAYQNGLKHAWVGCNDCLNMHSTSAFLSSYRDESGRLCTILTQRDSDKLFASYPRILPMNSPQASPGALRSRLKPFKSLLQQEMNTGAR